MSTPNVRLTAVLLSVRHEARKFPLTALQKKLLWEKQQQKKKLWQM